MKGFFLLFTISLLVMLQIQRGMLETTTPGTVTTTPAPARTTAAKAGAPAQATARATAQAPAQTMAGTTPTKNTSTSFATTKKQTGAAPALSSLGGVSILIILTNTFVQLFHLS